MMIMLSMDGFLGCAAKTGELTLKSNLDMSEIMSSGITAEIARERFDEIRERWTREVEIFDHFEGRLFVSATLITPELERARTLHHRFKLSLSETEYKKLLQNRLEQLQTKYRFFVSLSSSDLPKLRSSALTRSDLHAIDGSEDELNAHFMINQTPFSPTKIDRLNFNRAQAITDDFPFISPVKTGYWISFEVPERFCYSQLSSHKNLFALRFSGLSATATLEWFTKAP